MLKKELFLKCFLSLFLITTITACHDSTTRNGTSGNSQTISGSLTAQAPSSFPYNVPQTILVSLSSNFDSTTGAKGFLNLSLNTNPRSSLSLLTIDPASSCLAIKPSSTATTCTFIVTNNSVSGETALNNTGYYVTGQLAGQTVTSNVAYPGTQPPAGSYWTITINNQTGANQYLFVFGQNLQETGNPYGVVVFDSNNYGSFHTYSASTNYGSNENSIILTPGNNTIHIPYGIYGGRAYLSNQQMVGLELNSSGGIVTPSFTAAGNPNYNTIFDDFEFTYAADVVTNVSHAVVNQTQVDALGVPICINGTNNYVPITQAGFCNISRTSLLSAVTTAFNNITDTDIKNQWNSTVLKDGSDNILRIMNPGSSDALNGTAPITPFANYLDTYINSLVTSGQYNADNSLKVSLDGVAIISGNIAGTPATYTFNCISGSCLGQHGTMPLTSANLLTGAPPAGANTAETLAYEMVSSAFMAGQLPPTQSPLNNIITQTYLRILSPNTFYDSNSVSTANEYQYSVFSNALKAVQLDGTYTFPYNDVLGVSSTMTQTLTGPTDQPDLITVTVRY